MCFGGGSKGTPQQPQAVPAAPSPNAMTEAQFASYAPASLRAHQTRKEQPQLPSWSGRQLADLGKAPPGGDLIA